MALGHILTQGLGFSPDVRTSSDLRGEDAGVILNGRIEGRLSRDCDGRVSLGQSRSAFFDASPLHLADMARALGRSEVAASQLLLGTLLRRVSGSEQGRGEDSESSDFHVREWEDDAMGNLLPCIYVFK